MSELRSTSTRSAPQSCISRRESHSTGDRSWPARPNTSAASSRMRPLGTARTIGRVIGRLGLLLGPPDLRTNRAQLLLDRLVSAIEVIDAQDLGLARRDEPREDQARGRAQVGGHDL